MVSRRPEPRAELSPTLRQPIRQRHSAFAESVRQDLRAARLHRNKTEISLMHRDRDAARADDNRLVRLEELKGFQVAQADQDIRGWAVKTPDGRKIGKVEDLIVDPAERRVRYMEVKVDRKVLEID